MFAETFEPVSSFYLSNCISYSFHFAKAIQELNADSTSGFVVSFDIVSLFTNIPLGEMIDICADALYCAHLLDNIFKKLMLIATRGVEFNFNIVTYGQTDGNVHRLTLYYRPVDMFANEQ